MEPQLTSAAHLASLSWPDVTGVANHVVNLLESQGQAVVTIVRNLLKMIAAFTTRDMTEVFRLANEEYVDIQALTAAIKVEFGL